MSTCLINIQNANYPLSTDQTYCELSVSTALSNCYHRLTCINVGQLLTDDWQNSTISDYWCGCTVTVFYAVQHFCKYRFYWCGCVVTVFYAVQHFCKYQFYWCGCAVTVFYAVEHFSKYRFYWCGCAITVFYAVQHFCKYQFYSTSAVLFTVLTL